MDFEVGILVAPVVQLAPEAQPVLAVLLVLALQLVQLGHECPVVLVHPEDQAVHLFQANQPNLALLYLLEVQPCLLNLSSPWTQGCQVSQGDPLNLQHLVDLDYPALL